MRIISALWEAARKSIKRVSLIRYSHLSRCRDNRKEECMNLDEMLAASGITGVLRQRTQELRQAL